MSQIVLAPFSNSDIRDWPAEHYATLVGELCRRQPDKVLIIGTSNQRHRANDIVRNFDPKRVYNECGRLTWAALLRELRSAACVVGNNSGIAHLASRYSVPTICIFGGSHQRLEWRPMGSNVVLLTRTIACSPCHLDHGSSCRYDKACLQQIEPADVAKAVLGIAASPSTISMPVASTTGDDLRPVIGISPSISAVPPAV